MIRTGGFASGFFNTPIVFEERVPERIVRQAMGLTGVSW